MTLSTADDGLAEHANRARGLKARFLALVSIVLAILLSLTPFTAVFVLGWLLRIMRRETAIALCRQSGPDKTRKGAIARLASSPNLAHLHRFPGWWTGLMETLRSGIKGTIALAIATLPFGALLLLAWWAGWENSFNKGYEQAWVGPLVALAGAMLAVFVLVHLPMALAHHAAEQRVGAIWELRNIRRLIAAVRWRYMLLAICTVLASAPVFLCQIIPTFIEGVFPELAGADREELNAFAFRWHLSFSVYLVLVLLILRRWSARLYARANIVGEQQSGDLVQQVFTDLELAPPAASQTPGRWGGALPSLVMFASWFGVIAALFVAQFANHAWWNWVNLPVVGLPWIFRPF